MSDQPDQDEERLPATNAEAGSETERPVQVPPELPVLPLRDTVLFPNSFMPLAVAREASVRLVDEANTAGRLIGVFTQKEAATEEPAQDDLYAVGTVTHIHKMFKLPDGSLRLIVQGLARVTLDSIVQARPYLRAAVTIADDLLRDEDHLEIDALQRNIKSNFQQVVSLSPLLSDDLQSLAANITDPGKLADFIASSLTTIGTPIKQEILSTLDVRARMDALNRILIKELEVLELGSRIQSQVQSEVGKNQREYFLREQLKAIQKELGEGDEQAKEIEELRSKIDAAGMPEPVRKEALRELDRLSKMPAAAAEYTVSRTYVDWIISLPWAKRTDDSIDLKHTKQVLDADHSGLEKVKDRVLEYLAVRKLNPDVKGPILCFLGPPGVGKTSLAKSIANSLGRKFVRVSLGGMRDEAEIRGHRRTYIGALPGQVIQGLRRAESKNPVFILDEIERPGGLLEEQDMDAVYAMFQVNLVGVAHLTSRLLPGMLERGRGTIVNNASISGYAYFPAASTYAASKAGVVALTESLRRELDGTGVRALHVVTPGVNTDMLDATEEVYGRYMDTSGWDKVEPEEWAEKVLAAVEEDKSIVGPGGKLAYAKLASRGPAFVLDALSGRMFSRQPRR